MNTRNLSNDQVQALAAMIKTGRDTPSKTGLSIRTYRALVARGLASEVEPRRFAPTDDGRRFMLEYV